MAKKWSILESAVYQGECTKIIDVFVPFCSDESEAVEVATSFYPLDYNECSGSYTEIDGVNAHGTGYVVTIRKGYDY